MTSGSRSPRIEALSWGRIELGDGRAFKDVKLFPGGARAWDWRETGTAHRPGIQVADVAELLEHGADVVILSRGMIGALGITEETLSYLERHDVEIHRLRTAEAVELYNRLRPDRAVAGLFHSTC